jgi:hypothetical protein
LYEEEDVQSWVRRFDEMTQEAANKTLPADLTLPSPCLGQAPTFVIPESCKLPSTSQLPPPVEHSHYCNEENGLWTLSGLEKLVKELKKRKRESNKNQKASTKKASNKTASKKSG